MFELFIERHKRFLKIIGSAFRIMGWVMISAVAIESVFLWPVVSVEGEFASPMFYLVSSGVIARLPMAFLFLAVAQFTKCLLDDDYYPSWTLRYGPQLLIIYGAILLGYYISATVMTPSILSFEMTWDSVYLELPGLVSLLTRLLIVISLAEFLRRIRPMLTESRASTKKRQIPT